LVIAAGVLVLVYMLASKTIERQTAASQARKPAAVLVTVGTVTMDTMSDQVESLGTAQANESIEITAKVADTINKLHFEDGEYVKAGQVLVELTNKTESSKLTEAQASANDAKRQFDRVKELAEKKMIPERDLDTARTALETANARLEGVMVTMSDKVIRAPFSGVLGFRKASNGGLMTSNSVITTLDDISTIKLDFTVPEVYFDEIKPGLMIHARSVVYRDREFSGEIKVVGSRVDPVTRSVVVRAHLRNQDDVLRPGMLLTVKLHLNDKLSLVVPEQAVVVNGERQTVFVVDDQNIARQTKVSLGRRKPGFVEVLSGLKEGQRIIIDGTSQVRPGQPVQTGGSRESNRGSS
jgi:membrane fusion protein (multidrug efflux system)